MLYIDYVNQSFINALKHQRMSKTSKYFKNSKEMELHSEAVELMRTMNKKYNISTMTSLDEYLDVPGAGRISPEDVLIIKELINKF